MSTRVLLIGATGIVGADLLDVLAATEGLSVTATSRRPPTAEPRASVRWLATDLQGPFDLREAVEQADWVILNAASKATGRDLAELDELRIVNIDAVSSIVALVAAADRGSGAKKLLFFSSLGLLRRPFGDPITESDPCAPTAPYALSKLFGESLVKQLPHHCIFRIPSPVPSDWRRMDSTVLRRWIEAGVNGGTIEFHGQGAREQDFVSTADIAQACLRAMRANAHGIYHIASGRPVSMKTLAGLIKQRFVDVQVIQDATRDGNDGEKWRVDVSKAQRDFGYEPEFDVASAIDRMLGSASKSAAPAP